MGTPITTQNLIDAATDVAALSSIVNGAAGVTVTTRLGQAVQTLATAIASIISQQLTHYKGAYVGTADYVVGDMVTENGGTYIATQPSTGQTPAAGSSYWGVIAAAIAGPANTLTIGTVATGASGSGASAGITGAAPAQQLNLVLPAGPQVPTFPVYATTAAALTVVASGGYFLLASSNLDGQYDVYENVSGTATFLATLPKKQLTSSVASSLRIVDEGGFIYDVGSLIQSLRSQVAAMETEGLTVFTTTAAAIAAGIGTGSSFLIPSAYIDGAYDVYENVSGVATFQVTFQKKLLTSSTASPLRIVDSGGFVYDMDANLKSLITAAGSSLQTAINTLNDSSMAYSRRVASTILPSTMAAPDRQYNYVPWYGQSLSTGYQTQAVVSTQPKYGNLMIGEYPIKSGSAQVPYGNTTFNSLIEVKQAASAETECSGMCNTAKAFINRWRLLDNDTTRLLVANSLGQPGTGASTLTPTAAVVTAGTTYTTNYWSAVTNFFADFAAAAAANNGTCGCSGIFYCQGENDFTDSTSGDPGLAIYMANVLAIRAGFDALNSSQFGQTRQAGFYTYQTGAQWTSDATDLDMQNAQWLMALQQPNWFIFGPHYAYPDLGGHLTANSYRWLGSMAAKVWFKTAVLRQDWKPVMPIKVNMFNSQTLLVGYHVPCPPLTIATAYNVSTGYNFADLGFTLYDANGNVPISVSIVAAQVIQINATRAVDWTTARLRYADAGGDVYNTIQHYGMGNLCDSDTTVADDIYVASANQSGTPDGTAYDISGLVGNPYPLMNWSIAFELLPNTFNSTGPVVSS